MTALDTQVRITGLISYKALIDHALDNGLAAPLSIDIDRTDGLRTWVAASDAAKWVDSIHVDTEDTKDGAIGGREIVHVDGRLPLLGIKVQLRYSRRVAPAALRAVTA